MLDLNDLKKYLEDELNFEIEFSYSLENDGRIEIYCDEFNLEFKIDNTTIFSIENFNVSNPNNGLGSKIISLLIIYLKSNGFEFITLCSVEINVYKKFWKKFNFKPNDLLKDFNYYLEL